MKKTLIFVSVLAIVMFLVSSCSEPSLSRPATLMPGGGGSGTDIPVGSEGCSITFSVAEGDSFEVGDNVLQVVSIFSNSVELRALDMSPYVGYLVNKDEAIMLDESFIGVWDIAQDANDPELSTAILRTCANN